MKIDKEKPLPDHTKLDYEECCAKMILEEFFPDRYHDLLMADKPDLQGSDVGIEVTIASDQNMQEALSNWIKACSCENIKVRESCIDRMAQLGVNFTGKVQAWPGINPSFEPSGKAIEKKIKKLKNGNYKLFPRYELFVFTDTWYHETVIEDAKRYIFRSKVRDCFKTIYILSEGTDLHVFETDLGLHYNKKMDVSKQSALNIRARRMVEEAEEC